ncbi:MAG: phosphatidylglycerol lysyltransferase domain-containing protein [Thermodesulfobacteriota bacterium]
MTEKDIPFSPLSIADRFRVEEVLRRFPPAVSECTFTNLFVWRGHRPVFSAEVDGILFLIAEQYGGRYLVGPPLGPGDHDRALARLTPRLDGAIRQPLAAVASLRQAGFTLRADPDNADYVYRVADLADLAGRRYAKKRNLVKQCLAAHHCVYEEITDRNRDECLAMQDQWCDLRGCRDEPGLEGEDEAIRETFAHYRRLPIFGGAIRVDGAIRAFAIAEPLDGDTAVWHFEKAMPQYAGLGQLINQWFAARALGRFTYVNREQDLGIPGLRQAKESYFPCCMVPKYTTRTDGRPETVDGRCAA